jgi:prepilin-type N-terminal cleavage/methylation domain-containing protein
MIKADGFTLVEILVSMVILAITAAITMTVLKSVSQNQIEAKDAMHYAVATKSMKDAFNDFANSYNMDSWPDNQTVTFYGAYHDTRKCSDYDKPNVVGINLLRLNLCKIAESLSNATFTSISNSAYNLKDVKLLIHKTTKDDINYFTVSVNVHYARQESTVLFDRMFVHQVKKGTIKTQTN